MPCRPRPRAPRGACCASTLPPLPRQETQRPSVLGGAAASGSDTAGGWQKKLKKTGGGHASHSTSPSRFYFRGTHGHFPGWQRHTGARGVPTPLPHSPSPPSPTHGEVQSACSRCQGSASHLARVTSLVLPRAVCGRSSQAGGPGGQRTTRTCPVCTAFKWQGWDSGPQSIVSGLRANAALSGWVVGTKMSPPRLPNPILSGVPWSGNR